jgi:hypothetical protein
MLAVRAVLPRLALARQNLKVAMAVVALLADRLAVVVALQR